MAKRANSGKQELRAFVDNVNSDPLFRLRFLVDPARTLDDAGIQLNDKLKSALQDAVHEYVEKFPNIALLPTGLPYGTKKREPSETGAGGLGTERRTDCADPRILII